MLTKNQKVTIVEELADKLKRKKIAVFTDFHGVSVSKLQALRRTLKKDNAEYKVTKKTLLDRALESAGAALKTRKNLQGELGVIFGYGDEIAPVKNIAKFARENETFKILAALLENKLIDEKQVKALAKLPPREVLLAQVIGTMQSPIRGFVSVLNGNIRNLVIVLSKIRDHKKV